MGDKGDGGNYFHNYLCVRCVFRSADTHCCHDSLVAVFLVIKSVLSVLTVYMEAYLICRSLRRCSRGESNQRRIQDMEEKHSILVRFGDDTRAGMALSNRAVASRCHQA